VGNLLIREHRSVRLGLVSTFDKGTEFAVEPILRALTDRACKSWACMMDSALAALLLYAMVFGTTTRFLGVIARGDTNEVCIPSAHCG
jgi:hypothetical protein